MVRRQMMDILGDYDALLSPVAPTAAYKFGEKLSDPLSMYKGDLMTVPLNLAGQLAANCNFLHVPLTPWNRAGQMGQSQQLFDCCFPGLRAKVILMWSLTSLLCHVLVCSGLSQRQRDIAPCLRWPSVVIRCCWCISAISLPLLQGCQRCQCPSAWTPAQWSVACPSGCN